MTIPKEQRVALRLMGIPPECDQCVHWVKQGDQVNPAYRRFCEFYKSPRYFDDGKHCEYFSPQAVEKSGQ